MSKRRTAMALGAMLALLSGCGGETADSGVGQTPPGSTGGGSGQGGSGGGGGSAGQAGQASSGGSSGNQGGQAGSAGSSGNQGGQAGTGGSSGQSGQAGASGSSGTPGWQLCGAPGDCQLELASCCGGCGEPKPSWYDAVDYQHVDEHHKQVCPQPQPCPACSEGINVQISAFCRAGACGVVDVPTDDISACQADSDCVLHQGNKCCDCGTAEPNAYVALNAKFYGEYEAQICGPGKGGCTLDCAGTPPDTIAAACDAATKHCKVAQKAPSACPSSMPAPGSPCSYAADKTCEYGADLRIGCRTHAMCKGGTWDLAVSGCPPMPGPGQAGCPADTSVSGAACPTPETCDMKGGAMCECGSCFGGGACQGPTMWLCVSPPAAPCPAIAPNTGQPCASEGSACMYGVGCGATSAHRVCQGGVWVDDPVACPL